MGRTAFVLVLAFMILAPSVKAADDPWEGVNRQVFEFNEWTDRWFLRPAAVGYVKVVPKFVRTGVSNFFINIMTPLTAANQLLQGKPKASISDLGRFAMNTTLGVGGLIDVASPAGLAKNSEDLGQTFAVWGSGPGPYVVLPFFGPSNVRDSLGLGISSFVNPILAVSPNSTRAIVTAAYVVDLRAGLIGIDDLVMGDRYLFRKDTYEQQRRFNINDGLGEDDPFEQDGFDDDDDDDDF